MAIANDVLSWPFFTNISPATNAPTMAARPAAASTASVRSRRVMALATAMIAVPAKVTPSRACAVSARGAVAISVKIPACASAAGTPT